MIERYGGSPFVMTECSVYILMVAVLGHARSHPFAGATAAEEEDVM